MKLTVFITIDPVKEPRLLKILVHSLNLQTSQDFDVVFYNQTLRTPEEILGDFEQKPRFPYRFFNIEEDKFLGEYPIWNLYKVIGDFIMNDQVAEYIMSLHMEEFLDAQYLESFFEVLASERIDILFGNLSRTTIDWNVIQPILDIQNSLDFNRYLADIGLDDSPHWSYTPLPNIPFKGFSGFVENIKKLICLRFRNQLKKSPQGYYRMPLYVCEDVFAMKSEFARTYNWFLHGEELFFEDIHICEIKGICELAVELKKLTGFPLYFNRRKIYHLPHSRFYFQLEDPEFTAEILKITSNNPSIISLQEAIMLYQSGALTQQQALRHTRHNSSLTGTQNLNYQLHIKAIEASRG